MATDLSIRVPEEEALFVLGKTSCGGFRTSSHRRVLPRLWPTGPQWPVETSSNPLIGRVRTAKGEKSKLEPTEFEWERI